MRPGNSLEIAKQPSGVLDALAANAVHGVRSASPRRLPFGIEFFAVTAVRWWLANSWSFCVWHVAGFDGNKKRTRVWDVLLSPDGKVMFMIPSQLPSKFRQVTACSRPRKRTTSGRRTRRGMTSSFRSPRVATSTRTRGELTRSSCRVRHFNNGQNERLAIFAASLVGNGISTMSKDPTTRAWLSIATERFVPGEYVSISTQGTMHTYRVTMGEHP